MLMANPLHVVALGASAGGLEAIRELVAGLDGDFPAAIVVCIHTSAVTGNARIELLGRHSKLPAALAVEGEKLRAGHVYLAPPDHHLLVTRVGLLVRRGPVENNARPAIDPLFRSAAVSFGPRALGVILSGFTSQDGVSGLQAIKRCGGTTVVQDPNDAEHEGMPEQA
ncbi:MAG: chemotaxis protein CheB, partial [Alphaproteobacteria bacterium]|nr:chemotaxis protein CheB [Alphaproteobacteria bacterium]